MIDMLKQAAGSRWGLTAILALAAAAVGSGEVQATSAEGQAAGAAGLGVLAAAWLVVGPRVVGWAKGKLGAGTPPAGGASS